MASQNGRNTGRYNNRPPARQSGTRSGNTQSRARSSGGGRRPSAPRSPQRRRRQVRPIYTKLGFWIFICALIIVVVLIAKGCDTGKIDADVTPSAESLAPSAEQDSGSSQSPSQGGSTGNTNPVSPSSGDTSSPSQDESESDTGAGSGQNNQSTQPSEPSSQQSEPETSAPQTNYFEVHDIGAGVYLIGTDIPAGTVDLTTVSGVGSISTSNGSLSIPTFGNAESYTKTAENIVLYSGTNITVTGGLTLRISYVTKPEISTAPPSQSNTGYTFSAGTYTAGDDFESGTYDFSIVAGYGTVTSSNAEAGGGIDEMMGLADSGGNYSQNVSGISLPSGTVLTINGCTVKITKRN